MKTRHKLYSIFLFLFLASALQLMSPSAAFTVETSEKYDSKLDLFLMQAKLAYEKRSPVNFMQLVDESYSGRFDFTAGLLQRFSSCRELNIIFSVDSVLKGLRQISVWLRWHRKSRDTADRLNTENGAAQFLLIDTVEGYKLIQVNGDNPFF